MKRSIKIALVSATMAVSLFQASPAYAACGGPFNEVPAAVQGAGTDRNGDGFVCQSTRNPSRTHDNHGTVASLP